MTLADLDPYSRIEEELDDDDFELLDEPMLTEEEELAKEEQMLRAKAAETARRREQESSSAYDNEGYAYNGGTSVARITPANPAALVDPAGLYTAYYLAPNLNPTAPLRQWKNLIALNRAKERYLPFFFLFGNTEQHHNYRL
jgi:hypothetical protein